MGPECDLGLNPPSSQKPICQTLQEQKLHSRTLSPFAVTPSRLLGRPTEPVEGKDEEDLMRPTSASKKKKTSRENEKREGTNQQPHAAASPRDAGVSASNRAFNAISSRKGRDLRSRESVEGDFSSASTDV